MGFLSMSWSAQRSNHAASHGSTCYERGQMDTFMRFLVHMDHPDSYAAMVQVLSIWTELTCAHIEISPWEREQPPEPSILFWDLDAQDGQLLPPPIQGPHALFLCSNTPQAAISSYALHPTGFLRKPVNLSALQMALGRCTDLWWGTLDRMEILSDRLHFSLPLCNLVWAEGARRGCLLHSSQACIASRETLSTLEEHLPHRLFLRVQRSFLVNLYHVRSLGSDGLHMSDGAVVPLGRSSRKACLDIYYNFCRWRDGLEPTLEGEGRV